MPDVLDILEQKGATLEVLRRFETSHPFYSFEAFDKQQEFLRFNAKHQVVIGGNRGGKSLILSYKCVSRAIGYCPALTRATGQLITFGGPISVWIVSLDKDVSKDVMEPMVESFLPDEEVAKWDATHRQFTLKNGSIIGFKSCDSGRKKFQGTARDIVAFDEETEKDIYSECYARTVSCAGVLLFAFTAVEGSIWMHELLEDEEQGVEKVTIGMVDNPWIPRDEIVKARRRWKGDEAAIRIDGAYIIRVGKSFFEREAVEWQLERCREDDKFWRGELREEDGDIQRVGDDDGRLYVFTKPKRGRFYAVGGDPSSGDPTGDPCCIQVLDCATFEQVAVWHGRIDPTTFARTSVYLSMYYNDALLAIEANNHGAACIQEIDRMQYGSQYIRTVVDKRPGDAGTRTIQKLGWWTDKRTKPVMCNDLKGLVNDHGIHLNDRATAQEMRRFVYLREDAPTSQYGLGAASGHDDRVCALAIAVQAALQVGIIERTAPGVEPSIEDVILDQVASQRAELEDDADSVVTPWGDDDDDFGPDIYY